jgi:RND family efflux transporter MFP subunit
MNLLYRRRGLHLIISLLTLGLVSCDQKNEYIAPPPPDVTISQPIQKNVTEFLDFTGTTQSVHFAEVQARVSGTLTHMHFNPGSIVKQGDLLFVIDPEAYQAELAAAKAELSSAKAEFNRTQIELNRASELIRKNHISKTEFLKRQTERDVAQAAIGLKSALVRSAQIQLGYTKVTAPISGRVGRNLVDIGNLVGEGEATLLTTLTQYQPIYAYFHLNERDLLRLMKLRRDKNTKTGQASENFKNAQIAIPVYLGLSDEEDYPHQGKLDFRESALDTSTGTIELRAVFNNTENPVSLLPGLFSRLRVPVNEIQHALLIHESALASDQSGHYLLVINPKNKVEKRQVTVGQRSEGMIVIKKGLIAEDKVIINGLQKARPGRVVKPQTASSTAG